MKNILSLFSALALVLSSCSSDDSKESSVFVKKIVEIDSDGTSYTTQFTYDGVKKDRETIINNATNKVEYYMDYSYNSEGTIASVLKSTTDGKPLVLVELTYNDIYLKTILQTEFVSGKKNIKKTYYSIGIRFGNETVTYKTVDVDENNNAESNPVQGKLTLEDGKIVKDEITGAQTTTIVYEYDMANNPFKNVKGVEALLGNFDLGYSKFNKVKETSTTSSESPKIKSSTYSYDGKNFPTEAKHFDKHGNIKGSTQYFY
ncbi:hypothetical protein EYY60_11780 [Flavobacterium zhairuonense]|uniref:hypothetical protein n=1 Tax=Flavobacterium zhairuonense TaxID=2493631 RepID=UPI001052629B|nr:hypothetical protein [Flavobacterium zhairuonense]KAF2510183.1 hypothetical protein EYY60_11780 [Flavobacterium zhairuonense]